MHGLLLRTSLFFLLSIIVLNFNPQCVRANNAAAVTLIHVKGELFYSLDQGNTWKPIQDKREFNQGIFLKTGHDSEAAVMLKDRSQIRLDANSILNIQAAGSEPENEESLKKSILNFFKGKIWFRNKRRTNKPYINSPVISGSIRGTEVFLEVKEDGTSRFTVLEGELLCKNDYGHATAKRGEEIFAESGRAPEITKLLNPEKSVQWLLLTPEIKGPGETKISAAAQNALNALINNKVEKAFRLAEKAVAESPGSASSHVILATCYQSKGQFNKGLKNALKGRQLDTDSIPALVRAVELGLGLNLLKQASAMIDTFKGDRADPVVIMLKGYIELIQHAPLKAEVLFKKALHKKDDLSKAYLGLGLAQYQRGKISQALKNIEYASLMDPLAAYPHNYLGKALLETGERSEAMAELKRASQLDPNDPTPHLYLAAIKADSFRPGAAIKSLQKAMELNDNRLVTRSKYLLDSDTAVKNINMAWSLSQLGLYNRAKFMGDTAIWQDHSNSSAYMFRAVSSIAANNIKPSTLGDSRRELLLKPVNSNTYVTYSDYYSLMDKPLFKTTLAASGGNEESGAGRVSFHGGQNRTAYSFDFLSSTTNGVMDGTGKNEKRGIISAKHALNVNNELAVEVIAGNKDLEDTWPRQNGDLLPADTDSDIDFYSLTAGYHFKHGTDNHMLCLFQTEQRKNKKSDNEVMDYTQRDEIYNIKSSNDNTTIRVEFAELMRTGSHSLNFGAGWYDKNTQKEEIHQIVCPSNNHKSYIIGEKESDFDNSELRFYTRDIWYLLPDFMIDYGLGWSGMDNIKPLGENTWSDRNKFLPHIGGVWDITDNHRLRSAWFKELDPDNLNGSLQPVEVAGFEKSLGTVVGTFNETFALGWDCTWNSSIFTTVELYQKDITYPAQFNPIESENITWHQEDRNGIYLAYEQILTDQLAFSITCDLITLRTDDPDTERVDNEIRASVNWVHPSGLKVETGLWYVYQDEKQGYKDLKGDSFITGNLVIEKQFGKKKHSFFARCDNIADKQYFYMVRDTLQSSQLPEQGRLIEAGFRFNF